MKFPSGILASCGCSYGQRGPSFLHIDGEKGYFEIDPAYNYDSVHVRGEVNHEQVDQLSPLKLPYQFTIEAEHFADCTRNNKEPGISRRRGAERHGGDRSDLQGGRCADCLRACFQSLPTN